MNARRIEERSVSHYGRHLVIHVQRHTFGGYLFTVHVKSKIPDVVMAEEVGVRIYGSQKVGFFTIANSRSFGIIPNTALLMDKDCNTLENAKVLISTLFKYLATAALLSAVLCANMKAGFDLKRFTSSRASRNLKVVFDSASLFIRYKFDLAFANLISNRVPGSNISVCCRCRYGFGVVFDLLALFNPNPSFHKSLVLRVGGRGVAGQKICAVHIPEAVRQMRDGGIAAVGQYGLKERLITVEIGGFRYGHAIQGIATLTEEGM